MKILAVDTATMSCSVAVVADGSLKAELTQASGETHARHLMTMIDAVLEMSNETMATIDGLAVSKDVGLGSYFNTIMVGAYGAFTGNIGLDSIVEAVMEMAPTKPELNAEGSRAAFEKVTIIDPGNKTGGIHG